MASEGPTMTVLVITTGGSIAEDLGGGTVTHTSGKNLITAALGGRPRDEPIEVVDLLAVPSTWITPADMHLIGGAVRDALRDPGITGVVVTHGTATMEETAYWVDLVIDGDKPVVFTGSQRYPGSPGYDGYRNIADAISVAASTVSRGLGSLVVMDGEIHAARDVTKAHPTSMTGFRSLAWGPLGRIDFDQIELARRISADMEAVHPAAPLSRVDIVTCYAGMTGDVIDAVRTLGGQGLVVESLTTGGITRDMVGSVAAAVEQGLVVAITTRCAAGRAMRRSRATAGIEGYAFDLQPLGGALSHLHAPKARLRLIALLSSGLPHAEVFRRMDTAL
jgi:L-asparaginase